MTHFEYSKNANVATPCNAQHLTFGGRCLNCGYDPKRDNPKQTASTAKAGRR